MSTPRILVAGVGNIFLGDDAFGVEVAQRLSQRPQPEGVRVTDFGIRGLDLTYALLETWDVAILIDACPRGHAPGTLYIIEPEREAVSVPPQPDELIVQTHNMDPAKVLRLVWAMGGKLDRVLLVGCEPASLGTEEDMATGLSPSVLAAVEEAVPMVESLIAKLLQGEHVVSR